MNERDELERANLIDLGDVEFRVLVEENDDGVCGTRLLEKGGKFYLDEWGMDSEPTVNGLEEIDESRALREYESYMGKWYRRWPTNAPSDMSVLHQYDAAILDALRSGSTLPTLPFEPDKCVLVARARDMRRQEPIPELPEAATRDGVSYVAGPLIGPDGRRKYTCSGTPEVVRAFIEQWAPEQGLVDIYGDPARGFAGGYARD